MGPPWMEVWISRSACHTGWFCVPAVSLCAILQCRAGLRSVRQPRQGLLYPSRRLQPRHLRLCLQRQRCHGGRTSCLLHPRCAVLSWRFLRLSGAWIQVGAPWIRSAVLCTRWTGTCTTLGRCSAWAQRISISGCQRLLTRSACHRAYQRSRLQLQVRQ